MNPDTAISVLTCLVGVGVTVLLAGIPWAYSVHGRLSTIEASLKTYLNQASLVSLLDQRVTRLEVKGETHRLE